ncbi:MAG: sugar ABC transporter permease [Armatimonadetes bacterium]|nr:sugar ABC transporter permease [Armatimonadota bacterium]
MLLLAAYIRRKLREYGPIGKLGQGEAIAGYLFAAPWILGFLVFTIGPIVASIIFSFCDYDVLHAARWVGLLNYRELLKDDWYYLSKALYNAGFLAVFGLPLGMATGLAIAMLLNTKVGGMTWYRTIYYLPSIVPIVANAILWVWVLNPEFGLINAAWRATLGNWFNLSAPLWLSHESTSKPALIMMGLWGAGGGMILWLAGLQGIPQHLYEAADIDGANWWSRFWNVTIPMLTPYLFFNLIMGTIGVLQTFETIYIMTGGGPVDSTIVPVFYLFNNAFTYFKMGYASALAWLLFVIILVLTVVQLKLAPRWVHYEAEKGK